MAQVVIQKGGIADGRMECDGKRHRWVYAQWKEYGLPEVLPMGRCPDAVFCQQRAALLIQQAKEEEERVAKAIAALQSKQQSPAAKPQMPAASPASAASVTKG